MSDKGSPTVLSPIGGMLRRVVRAMVAIKEGADMWVAPIEGL
jgi:hypothetical protein